MDQTATPTIERVSPHPPPPRTGTGVGRVFSERVEASPGIPRLGTAACYVDFENLLYSSMAPGHTLSVPRIVRHLNRLGRQASGIGWNQTGVYAAWDNVVTYSRHAQDDWAMLGWRTVAVPTKEDYLSTRPVKNLVDFVMSLDMLEDARDRAWDHFFIVSGDADFCEVAERLKRLRRRVTVVALKPNLSFRLREAADDFIVWSFEDITGDEPLSTSYRRLVTPPVPRGRQDEDPYQVLLRAVRLAERDQGVAPVTWRLIRDEYFLRMLPITEGDADRFVRELDRAGFVTVVSRRSRDGQSQVFLNIPR